MYRIVLDTETAGGLDFPLVYDLGYCVINNDGDIIKTRSYIIKEVYDNPQLFKTAFYKDKRNLYEERLKSKYSKKVYFAYALRQLIKDMEKYGVDLYAYNSNFDNKAIKHTQKHFNKIKYNPLENGIIDIMDYIQVITDNEQYKKYCQKNHFLTRHKKPQPKKTAEVLYSYLINDPQYKEEHTGLEDSKIEAYILTIALKG